MEIKLNKNEKKLLTALKRDITATLKSGGRINMKNSSTKKMRDKRCGVCAIANTAIRRKLLPKECGWGHEVDVVANKFNVEIGLVEQIFFKVARTKKQLKYEIGNSVGSRSYLQTPIFMALELKEHTQKIKKLIKQTKR